LGLIVRKVLQLRGLSERHYYALPVILAVLALLVALPSLWNGFCMDDHLMRLIIKGFPGMPEVMPQPRDFFAFAGQTPAQQQVMIDRGLLPWWTTPHWRVAFWRPLTSWSHWLDWHLWGDHALPMHVENLVWYAALVAALAILYRRFLTPSWVVGLAGLLYLLDAAHGMPVGWIANRNGVMSAFFVVLTIYCHDRWRRDNWRPGASLGVVALGLSLLSGESGVAAGGYLAAYMLFMERASWHKRLLSLVPYGIVVILWRLVYSHLGYGATGGLLYVDPGSDPLQFALDTLRYWPVLMFAQLVAGEAMGWNFLPPIWKWSVYGAAIGVLLLLAAVLAPLLKKDRAARFWAAGMALSLLPSCAAVPQSRLLFISGIGAMALIAQFIAWRTEGAHAGEGKLYRNLAHKVLWAWVVLHIAISAVAMPIASCSMGMTDRSIHKMISEVPVGTGIENRKVIVVNSFMEVLPPCFLLLRLTDGMPVPKYCRLLTAGNHRTEIKRIDDQTLLVTAEDGFMSPPWAPAFRNLKAAPMHQGQTVALDGMIVEVVSVAQDGRPREMLFRFDAPLEDASFQWLAYRDGHYVEFVVPRVGETVRVDNPTFIKAVLAYIGISTT